MKKSTQKPIAALPYIDFANEHYIGARFDLASSNIPSVDLAALSPPPDQLTANSMILRDQARELLAQRYGVHKENIALTIGCTGANASMAAVLGQGAEILVETPGYEPMWATPSIFGARVRTFARPCQSGAYDIDPDAIEARIGKDTRAVWLTNLHNPSGSRLTRDRLTDLAARLDRLGVMLYVDEIYIGFLAPLGQESACKYGDNVVVASSLTKVYGLGNLRFGWMVGPEPIMRQINTLQMHLTGIPVGPALAFGIAALGDLDRVQRLATGHLKGRPELLARTLDPGLGFHWSPPVGGIVGLLSIDGVEDDLAFTKALVHQSEVVIAPGHFFGLDGMFRLSFGALEPGFSEGLERLLEFVRRYRG